MSRVLVTGASGFVGSHTIIRLLQAGHAVCATIRHRQREADVRAMLKTAGVDAAGVAFCVADLLADAGWEEAVRDCDYVLHIASPFPAGAPEHEDDLIAPAREGTLRVLRAARDAGVKRAVVTSSFAAVGYGHRERKDCYTEVDWTDPTGADVTPYVKSKTLAERAAWDFIRGEGGALELAVVNPVGIFGPALGTDYSSSIGLLKALLDGAMPATPRIYFGAVDVRDVADLHLRAMTHQRAAGERFIAVSGPAMSLHHVAMVLRERLGVAARRVPRFQLPDGLARCAAHFSPAVRAVVPQIGIVRNASSDKASEILGWSPRPADDAIAASGESLLRFRLLDDA